MPDDVRLLDRQQQEAETLARLLHGCAENLPEPERAEAFGAHFDKYGDARVVLLGEATHGTAEFYRARAAITQTWRTPCAWRRTTANARRLRSNTMPAS